MQTIVLICQRFLLNLREQSTSSLKSTHSNQWELLRKSHALSFESSVLFETLLISRAMNWLATLSIDPDLEVRRGTLSVFSELRAAYSSQKTLHELHCYLHDNDKKLLETKIRGAMSDLGGRLTKAAVAPTGAIQKRHNVANELKPICALARRGRCSRLLRDLTVSRSLHPTLDTSRSNTT
jgi:hypothetical protein